ncbi:Cof-type HAD-IIB family hydrolase [Mangrovibacillus cuniculi]|uniref:HAD family phosphatase n=1 Tax=Mangrovibacillus cuniculi TaxID=2593652 RepID=A0A7S8HEN7_9BACI|nr:Cof-type HAD-IIB family hydrolase [Mangrovibacillus cuniculi]QPC46054.1 HAD family phosphatase [Mangrovibacillus cuniculi]
MEKHLICLDLDGTLLTDEKVISPYTKAVLKELQHQGHEIMIATGRPFRASEMYYKELELTTPIVNFNGAFTHHPQDDSWEAIHTTIDLQTVHQIVKACEDFSFHNMLAEVKDHVFIHYHDEKLLSIFSENSSSLQTGPIQEILTENPTSLLIHADEEDVPSIRQHLSNVYAEVVDHRRWAAPWHVIEVISKGMNKFEGIKKVAMHYDIPHDRIIAFGDEDNDLEMLTFAGTGLAMGNGTEEVKAVANEVIGSNEEDGIGNYLAERFSINI